MKLKSQIKKANSSGYIALATVLVIFVALVLITGSASLLAIDDSQLALASRQREILINQIEGCVEDALLRLNENDALPTTITQPEGSCDITLDSQAGSTWTFTVEATKNNATKRVQVVAERTSTITISQWLEQP